MGIIYSNPLLVIAATGADDTSHGCFLPRAPPAMEPVIIQHQIHDRDGTGRVFMGQALQSFSRKASGIGLGAFAVGLCRSFCALLDSFVLPKIKYSKNVSRARRPKPEFRLAVTHLSRKYEV